MFRRGLIIAWMVIGAVAGSEAGFVVGAAHRPPTAHTATRKVVTHQVTKKVVVYRTRTIVKKVTVYRTRVVTHQVIKKVVVYQTRVVTVTVSAPNPTPSPEASATSVPNDTGPNVHICLWVHFDQTNTRCLQDDLSVTLTQESVTQIVWPNAVGNEGADVIQVLKRDGTGNWVVVSTFSLDGRGLGQQEYAYPNGHTSTDLLSVFAAAPVGTDGCNETLLLRVESLDGTVFGFAPITLTC